MVAFSPPSIPTFTAAPTPAAAKKPRPPVATPTAATVIPDAIFETRLTIESCFVLYLSIASSASERLISPFSAFSIVSSIASEPFLCPKKFFMPSQAFPKNPCSFFAFSNSSLKVSTDEAPFVEPNVSVFSNTDTSSFKLSPFPCMLFEEKAVCLSS